MWGLIPSTIASTSMLKLEPVLYGIDDLSHIGSLTGFELPYWVMWFANKKFSNCILTNDV